MKKHVLTFLFLFFVFFTFGQRAVEGERLINNKEFSKALTIYEVLLKQKPNDPKTNFLYALCSYELKRVEKAIYHFEIAAAKLPASNMYLGELYFNAYKFEESVMAYQTFMSTLLPEDERLVTLQLKMQKSEMAAKLMGRVDNIAITDSALVDKADFLKYYKFASDLGTLSSEEIKSANSKPSDKVKYVTQRQDRTFFSDTINGHLDLFTSFKLLDSWSAPISISGMVNTLNNESYPFLLLDGATLYFASDSEKSIGGYDLYITRYNSNSNTYLIPENIGFPFNSPANDYMMVIDELRGQGWFATDRNQVPGKVMIYSFVPNETRDIVKTENKEMLRNLAMLKSYRKQEMDSLMGNVSAGSKLQKSNEHISFVINDSLVYTSVDDFRSKAAFDLLTQWYVHYYELKNLDFHLTELRSQFGEATSNEERKQLSSHIIQSEEKQVQLANQLKIMKIKICNEEIKFLQIVSVKKK